MPTRTEDAGHTRAGPGGSRTRSTRTADGGTRTADGGTGGTGVGSRAADRTRAGVGGTRAAGIPVASTPSSALRLHVPAPAP